jgi:endonuclease YncB( thermonuclease family)
MPGRLLVPLFIASLLVSQPAVAGGIGGTPRVIDGRTLEVAGERVTLSRIAVPALGTPCRWRGQSFDCGRLARAGLMDLVAGATIACRAEGEGYICLSGGYDLAFGLIHAGWAVPLAGAPPHWFAKMREAEGRRRGLWSATDEAGSPLAPALTR